MTPAETGTVVPAKRRWRRWWPGGVLAVGALWLGLFIHPFLAVSAPIRARVLVVEGWLPDYALDEAVAEFRRGGYVHVYTTGGPHPHGSVLAAYHSYADSAAAILVRSGLRSDEVTAVPSLVRERNRTYGAAVALHDYCRQYGRELESVNLVTVGAHARRSWLCFRRALGEATRVGVISLENREYDPRRWWKSSEGLKVVLGEPIGLLYAWLAVDYGN